MKGGDVLRAWSSGHAHGCRTKANADNWLECGSSLPSPGARLPRNLDGRDRVLLDEEDLTDGKAIREMRFRIRLCDFWLRQGA